MDCSMCFLKNLQLLVFGFIRLKLTIRIRSNVLNHVLIEITLTNHHIFCSLSFLLNARAITTNNYCIIHRQNITLNLQLAVIE